MYILNRGSSISPGKIDVFYLGIIPISSKIGMGVQNSITNDVSKEWLIIHSVIDNFQFLCNLKCKTILYQQKTCGNIIIYSLLMCSFAKHYTFFYTIRSIAGINKALIQNIFKSYKTVEYCCVFTANITSLYTL